ncbi:MAG: efflux RND transporter periplasmic adaptor subunit [Methylomonas sp.]|nr:efflux RND transporter periplasmic adaptor subunit [Methylomonas sp.]PPD20901.1 MAG: efflux transporter periplasmic adaptor subunit [Methylomonas sp.]PPD24848.1 MAG: efflux transporter periplasmic adaptor subunit [Methylomonas sp.]PPD33708.1 MAG: efflux transporter periplasmic adaptor subunit [Methylomonas sp.]PPD39933.1 MAG: efflux transporter periplasmic adaptor subunit [Methylomonas sp.]
MPETSGLKTRKRWRKTIAVSSALTLATAASIYWYTAHHEQRQQQETVTITLDDIEETVTSHGKLEPKEYVDVGAQVTGQLQKLYVEIGNDVTEGQLLAEIDPRLYVARVQANEANIRNLEAQRAGQQANIVFARQLFERNRELIKTNGVSEQDFQNSEFVFRQAVATADSISAQIEQVESTLRGDRANLSFTRIFAPIAGTVVQRTARLGQTLNANQTTPMILQLAKLDAMTVRAQVAEADITRIKLNMPVYFLTLGSGDRRWQATVRQILPSPETINNVVLYNVLVDVDNHDRQLMTGMSTQMFFLLGRAEKVPVIPVSALGRRRADLDDERGLAYEIHKQVDATSQPGIVHVGLQNRRFAEVRSGADVGDAIVLPNQHHGTETTGGRKDKGYTPPGVPRL